MTNLEQIKADIDSAMAEARHAEQMHSQTKGRADWGERVTEAYSRISQLEQLYSAVMNAQNHGMSTPGFENSTPVAAALSAYNQANAPQPTPQPAPVVPAPTPQPTQPTQQESNQQLYAQMQAQQQAQYAAMMQQQAQQVKQQQDSAAAALKAMQDKFAGLLSSSPTTTGDTSPVTTTPTPTAPTNQPVISSLLSETPNSQYDFSRYGYNAWNPSAANTFSNLLIMR